jgi:hypothetical protein
MSPSQAPHRLASCSASGLHPALRLPSRVLLLHRFASRSSVLLSASLFGPSAPLPSMASADFCNRIREPCDPRSLTARLQISPGIAHSPSRLYASDIRHRVPYMYRALHLYACSPHGAASIRFLFVAPAFCFRLPSDSRSPEKPLPSANTCPCRLCRGLPPPSECALPGAHKKGPEFLRIRGHIFRYFLLFYSAASVSPAGTASSESPTPPLTSMKLRRRVSSNARRRRA